MLSLITTRWFNSSGHGRVAPSPRLLAALILLIAPVCLLIGCHAEDSGDARHAAADAFVAKWFDNRTAAISITYDSWPLPSYPAPAEVPDVDGYVREQGLVIGYELVTGNTIHGDPVFPDGLDDRRLTYLLEELIPNGFGYFGHGHDHIDHDALSYEDALRSFRTNYETMQRWGLQPVAYAYPRSAGHEAETQRALADAGFLSGRLQTTRRREFYNLAGSRLAPDNWYALKALEMQSIEFANCRRCINDNRELTPVLDEALRRTAWVILTYHAIGHPEWWGWYDWDEFRKDVRSIAARDFWVAPMNDIVRYVRERELATVTVDEFRPAAGGAPEHIEITLADGLDNDLFDQPLTLLFDLPAEWVGVPFTVAQGGEIMRTYVFDTEDAMLSLQPNELPYVLAPAAAARS